MKDTMNTIPGDILTNDAAGEYKFRPFQTAAYDEYGLRNHPIKVKMSEADYRQLKRIRDEHGRRSLGDAVVYLIRTYV
jgi:hypothetical protein